MSPHLANLTTRIAALVLLGSVGCASSGTVRTPNESTTHTTVELGGGGGIRELPMATRDDIHTFEIPASADRAWQVTPDVYAELEIPVAAVDSSQRAVRSTTFRVRHRLGPLPLSDLFNCGNAAMGTPNADTYTLNIELVTQLQSLGTGPTSTVSTQVSAQAKDEGSSSPSVRCGSTGHLERQIAERIARHLRG